jgi:hypothetical protein
MTPARTLRTVVAERLTAPDWAGLLRGEIGVLRVPGFLSAGQRQEAVTRLYAGSHFEAYDPIDECGGVDPVAHRQIQSDLLEGSEPGRPPVTRRLGRTLYEYAVRDRPHEYFKLVEEFDAARRATFTPGGDVIDSLLALISEVVGAPASIAEEPGFGRCYAGVIREVHGRSRLHTDDAREETPGFLVGALPFQLGLYVILDMPERGGDMIVYDREYRPDDGALRHGYGLDPIAVAGDGYIGICPRPGDLILFPDRNIHRVDPCSGDGRRIMLQAHLGVNADGSIVCWS